MMWRRNNNVNANINHRGRLWKKPWSAIDSDDARFKVALGYLNDILEKNAIKSISNQLRFDSSLKLEVATNSTLDSIWNADFVERIFQTVFWKRLKYEHSLDFQLQQSFEGGNFASHYPSWRPVVLNIIPVHRGDHIVPNFEEIWPSGKGKNVTDGNPNKGVNYVKKAMEEGLAGSRNEVFTTVGKPKVIFCFKCRVRNQFSQMSRSLWNSGGSGAVRQPHPVLFRGSLDGDVREGNVEVDPRAGVSYAPGATEIHPSEFRGVGCAAGS